MTISPKDLAGRMQPLPKTESRPEKRKRKSGYQLIELQESTWDETQGMSLHLKNRTNTRDFVFMTPVAARHLADKLHDFADRVEAKQNQKEA